MSNNSVAISQLPNASNVVATDKILVLYNAISNGAVANGSPSVRTISVENFITNPIIAGNAAQAYTNAVAYVDSHSFVNTSQLSSNLLNYQTLSGLSSNVATLTSNNSNFLNGNSVANLIAYSTQAYVNAIAYSGNASQAYINAVFNSYQNTVSYVQSLSLANTQMLSAYAPLSGAQFSGTVHTPQLVVDYAANAGSLNVSGGATISGNLVVHGSATLADVTYINATVITTSDKNFVLANNAYTSLNANGSGIAVSVFANLIYMADSNAWQSNVNLIPSTNNLTLGTSNNLWNIYSNTISTVTANVNTLTVNNSTVTNSNITSANITTASIRTINANGSVGTSGQFLTSNGSSTYWSTLNAGLVSGNTVISNGASGQVLFDNGGTLSENSGFVFNSTNPALTLNGGTVTTSNPVLNLSQTWNASGTTFTGFKFNATDTASASGSLLMDLQVGGVSKFNVTKTGAATGTSLALGGATIGTNALAITGTSSFGGVAAFAQGSANAPSISYVSGSATGIWFPSSGNFQISIGGSGIFNIDSSGNITARNTGAFAFNSTSLAGGAPDTFLTRAAAATLQLGAADAAAPVAQTIGVQNVVAGTSNTNGANFTIRGSAGTGTGLGGSIIFQVAPAGTTGTAQNAFATALTIDSTKAATFAGTVAAAQLYNPTQTLTDGATISWNTNISAVATVTLGGTGRTLTLSNLVAGGTYILFVVQDATGSRTITTWTNFKWPGGIVPTLSTAANAIDIITGVSNGTYIYAAIQPGFA